MLSFSGKIIIWLNSDSKRQPGLDAKNEETGTSTHNDHLVATLRTGDDRSEYNRKRD